MSMKFQAPLRTATVLIAIAASSFAATIQVPSDQPGNQAGVVVASERETVLAGEPQHVLLNSGQACPDSISLLVIDLLNQVRIDSGLWPLEIDERLVESAQFHADDMWYNECFDFANCNGTPWYTDISNFGYPEPSSRFIAAGFETAESVVSAWVNDPGYLSALLDTTFYPHRHIGAGHEGTGIGLSGKRWSVDFGSSTTTETQTPACLLTCCDTPGDFDNSGAFNIADVTAGIAFIFSGGGAATCVDEADADGDNSFNIADVTYGIAHIFSGGPAPVCGTTGA